MGGLALILRDSVAATRGDAVLCGSGARSRPAARRRPRPGRGLTLLALASLALAGIAAAQGGGLVTLQDVTVLTQEGATVVLVKTSGSPRHQVAQLDNPFRILVDLADTEFAWRRSPLAGATGLIKEIRGSQYRKGIARLVIELTGKAQYLVEAGPEGLTVVLRPVAATPPAVQDATPSPPSAAAAKDAGPAVEPPVASPTRPVLYGIIYGERGWIAYIEDPATRTVAAYRVGDALGGGTIEVIEEERVLMKGPEGAVELRLSDDKPGRPRRPR